MLDVNKKVWSVPDDYLVLHPYPNCVWYSVGYDSLRLNVQEVVQALYEYSKFRKVAV